MHSLRMFWQVLRYALIVAFITFSVFFYLFFSKRTTDYDLYIVGQYIEAEIKLIIHDKKIKHKVRNPNGQSVELRAIEFVNSSVTKRYLRKTQNAFESSFWQSLMLALVVLILFLSYLKYKGKKQNENTNISGKPRVEPSELRRILKKQKKASEFTLANVPLVKGSECQHILLAGSTGSGKSLAMKELIDQARDKGHRAIVYDIDNAFISSYYREGIDVILNPLDIRSPAWNIWQECKDIADFDTAALALMPLHLAGTDPFWIHSAHTIFSSAAFKLQQKNQAKTRSKELQDKADNQYSKIVQVVKTKKSKSSVEINGKTLKADRVTLTLKDREGNVYTAHAHELKPNRKVKNASLLKTMCYSTWTYFPPFEQRKSNELPLSTSQQALLIDITRGDGLFLVVPYLNDLQKTLEAHGQLKRSALSYTDPEWKKLNESVNRLVADIKGSAEEKIKNHHAEETSIKSPNHSLKSVDKRSRNQTKNFPTDKINNFIDKDAINYRLESNILGYATQWVGSPKKISGYEARWPGALTVNIKGPKAGMWKRWSTGEGGKDLISLYMAAFGLEWKEAIKELANGLGISHKDKQPAFKIKNNPKSVDIDSQEKINKAKELYKKAIPIYGTLAEKYLKEHRHIIGDLPRDFKFIKAIKHFETKEMVPALLAPIKDKEEKLVGIVRIYLNKDGSKYSQTFIDAQGNLEKATAKANLGISSKGSVTVQKGIIPSTLFVAESIETALSAEGIETALSIAKAQADYKVVASLSVNQFKNVPTDPHVQKVVICADKDEANSQTAKAVIDAIDHHLAERKKVFLVMPSAIGKCDFNDLLKEGGIEAVRSSLEKMIEIKDTHLLKTEGLLAYTKLETLGRLTQNTLDNNLTGINYVPARKSEPVRQEPIKDLER